MISPTRYSYHSTIVYWLDIEESEGIYMDTVDQSEAFYGAELMQTVTLPQRPLQALWASSMAMKASRRIVGNACACALRCMFAAKYQSTWPFGMRSIFDYAPTIARFRDASPEMRSESRHLNFPINPMVCRDALVVARFCFVYDRDRTYP